MMIARCLIRMKVFLAVNVAGLVLLAATHGRADGTSGSFCYKDPAVTRVSKKVDGSVTFTARVKYHALRSCSGTQVGIHVIWSQMSYSGGFNGTDKYGGKHGMVETGLSYKTCQSAGGDEIYARSVFSVRGYPRSYTYNANKLIYSGKGHNGHLSFSFADTGVFAYYKGPYGPLPQAFSTNVWYIPLRNQWVLCTGGHCGWGCS